MNGNEAGVKKLRSTSAYAGLAAADSVGNVQKSMNSQVGRRARALVGLTRAGADMSAVLPFCTTVARPGAFTS